MEKLKVKILDWDKYNPKRDQKNYTWFRLNNDIGTDPDLFGLDAEQRYVWIVILSLASQKNSPEIAINTGYLEHITGVKQAKILELIAFLEEKPIISVVVSTTESGRVHDNVRSSTPTQPTPTNERDVRYERDDTNETDECFLTEESANADPNLPDLLRLWNDHCGDLPKAEKLTTERQRQWKARWKEKPDPEYWVSVIKRVSKSPFCTGQNDRGWRAGIDFILKPTKHLKVIEGQYDMGPRAVRRRTFAEDREASHKELYAKVEAGEI